MLSNATDPVAWALLVTELDDAHEHLGNLIAQMVDAGSINESDYRIQLGHVFAHLNRAWNGRNTPMTGDFSDEAYAGRSQFPADLLPIG